jgi:hypothetical protein
MIAAPRTNVDSIELADDSSIMFSSSDMLPAFGLSEGRKLGIDDGMLVLHMILP